VAISGVFDSNCAILVRPFCQSLVHPINIQSVSLSIANIVQQILLKSQVGQPLSRMLQFDQTIDLRQFFLRFSLNLGQLLDAANLLVIGRNARIGGVSH
jgi:hypothetical protein